MRSSWKTDTGRIRDNNEDSILVDEENGIFLLADGLGGHVGGEVASSLAVRTVYEYLKTRLEQIGSAETFRILAESVAAAHSAVFRKSLEVKDLKGMGTTLEIALFAKSAVFICHVGDSRVYLFRSGKLEQITTDDNAAAWLKEYEHVPMEQIPPGARHLLTQAVGISRELVPEFHSPPLRPGDLMMLCSDGLTEILDDREIAGIILTCGAGLCEAADALVDEANSRGGPDNISVILVNPQVTPFLLV
ncbi:MAG TPA: protein phosphatase 2C domain-containing protein [Geobacteraceae bacterium]|nr:protein phosphatase 2C domain-containing protein [Geobacteraceae bacterium]